MMRSRYAGPMFLEHRLHWCMSERDANRRSFAIRNRLHKKGISYKWIRQAGLDNPFMTEDARTILVGMAGREKAVE